MSLKSLITETVLIDSMYDIESELLNIKEALLEQMIIEGVDDPGILKCVFMAGGPGSGKSFTAMETHLRIPGSSTPSIIICSKIVSLMFINSDSTSNIESRTIVSVSNDLIPINGTPFISYYKVNKPY